MKSNKGLRKVGHNIFGSGSQILKVQMMLTICKLLQKKKFVIFNCGIGSRFYFGLRAKR